MEYFTSDDSSSSSSDEEIERQDISATPKWQLLFFLFLWQSLYHVSNNALNALLSLLSVFFQVFKVRFSSNDQVQLPNNIVASKKVLKVIEHASFIEFVVCPKCQAIYEYKDCIYTHRGLQESKTCRYIAFPMHSQHSMRQPCGAILLKKVKIQKRVKFVPIKVYPYQPLSNSITYLVNKPGFLESCEMWRKNRSPDDYLVDIYDGKIWSEYISNGFLRSPYCYMLTLNLDWFQPFTHVEYSVGAIYLALQNLPREERYKEENIILVGVLPGPSEPKLTVNSYLAPLVEDLKAAWLNGIKVKTSDGLEITVRLALTCVACDLPASRKVCGFLSHNAELGCNKCLKKFSSSSFGVMDYSGYNRDTWVLRTGQKHREDCRKLLKKTTKSGLRKCESNLGVRYSVLLSLPYFDPVRYTVVDIMHNMYLGTGKHVFKQWLSSNLLTKDNLTDIDKMIKSFIVPNYIGRLPINISSNYGGYTASQWQSWITLYSPVVLKNLLPTEHYRCWLLYVRACFILCRRSLTKNDVVTADLLLLNFCKQYELLYGKETCTPNLHLHNHLKECLLDYGPSHTFWCFSFERFNGVLGSFHTNRKAVGTQIMRKFVNTQNLQNVKSKADLNMLIALKQQDKVSLSSKDENFNVINLSTMPLDGISFFQSNKAVVMLPPLHEDTFCAELLSNLESFYKIIYPHYIIEHISQFFVRCGRVTLCNQLIGSSMNSRCSNSSSVIGAYWPTFRADVQAPSTDYSAKLKIGIIQYFFKHQIVASTPDKYKQEYEHKLAYVKWYQKHLHEDWYGTSAVVCSNTNDPDSPCSFIPIQRIHAVCAHCTLNIQIGTISENVFVAVPIPTRYDL